MRLQFRGVGTNPKVLINDRMSESAVDQPDRCPSYNEWAVQDLNCDHLRVMHLGTHFWRSVMSNFVSLAECQRHRADDATIARVRTRECDLAKSDGARSQ